MSKKIFTLTLAVLIFSTLAALAALAADKVVVIPVNSSSQLYVAGTEITSLPYTISSSGSYFVMKNLTCTAGAHGITINSDNVTINLMGFSLIGPGGTGDNHGIYVDDKSNIEISNGSVINFAGSGIYSGTGSTDTRIINIRANNHGSRGIQNYSIGGLIEKCSTNGNGYHGIESGIGNFIRDCSSTKNSGHGFFGSGNGGIMIGNTSAENGGDGIVALNGGVVMNNAVWWNISGTGINFLYQGNVLVDKNTAYQNGVDIGSCPTCTFGTNHTTTAPPP